MSANIVDSTNALSNRFLQAHPGSEAYLHASHHLLRPQIQATSYIRESVQGLLRLSIVPKEDYRLMNASLVVRIMRLSEKKKG